MFAKALNLISNNFTYMFWIEDKETIFHIDEDKKYIELCPSCDRLNKFTDKWDNKGYSISHIACKKCIKEYY